MKKIILAATVAVAAFAAAPAAALDMTRASGSAELFTQSAQNAQFTFENAATGNGGNPAGFTRIGGSILDHNSTNVGANPFGAPAGNSYLYVMANQIATITANISAIAGYKMISFYMGSIDAGNTVEVLGAGGAVIQSYNGTLLAKPTDATGDQTSGGNNRFITFTAQGNEVLTGIRFRSTVNSLEADNVRFTAAVPEPATWAMMLVGFGMVGAGMRYRSRKGAVKFVTA
jgi:hypothetical protein